MMPKHADELTMFKKLSSAMNKGITSKPERKRPPPPPAQLNGSSTSIDDSDSASVDSLEGQVTLNVILPDGRTVLLTVEKRMPMMDLLIHAATANKISPGSHVINIFNEHDKSFLAYKPSTPIGSLHTGIIYIVPKKTSMAEGPNKTAIKNASQFEQTFRLQVHLPRQQLLVLRVSKQTILSDLHKMICNQKGLDPPRYALQHPLNQDIPLDYTCSLHDYNLTEINMVSKRGSVVVDVPVYSNVCIENIDVCEAEEKKNKSMFGFMFRRSKSSLGDSSSDDRSSRGVSPVRSDGSGQRSVSPPSSNPSTLVPARAVKKRVAPLPPAPKQRPPVERPPPPPPLHPKASSSSDNSHSRQSSESNSLHDLSALSDSGGSERHHPRRELNLTSRVSSSLPNVALIPGMKKRRAPLPPQKSSEDWTTVKEEVDTKPRSLTEGCIVSDTHNLSMAPKKQSPINHTKTEKANAVENKLVGNFECETIEEDNKSTRSAADVNEVNVGDVTSHDACINHKQSILNIEIPSPPSATDPIPEHDSSTSASLLPASTESSHGDLHTSSPNPEVGQEHEIHDCRHSPAQLSEPPAKHYPEFPIQISAVASADVRVSPGMFEVPNELPSPVSRHGRESPCGEGVLVGAPCDTTLLPNNMDSESLSTFSHPNSPDSGNESLDTEGIEIKPIEQCVSIKCEVVAQSNLPMSSTTENSGTGEHKSEECRLVIPNKHERAIQTSPLPQTDSSDQADSRVQQPDISTGSKVSPVSDTIKHDSAVQTEDKMVDGVSSVLVSSVEPHIEPVPWQKHKYNWQDLVRRTSNASDIASDVWIDSCSEGETEGTDAPLSPVSCCTIDDITAAFEEVLDVEARLSRKDDMSKSKIDTHTTEHFADSSTSEYSDVQGLANEENRKNAWKDVPSVKPRCYVEVNDYSEREAQRKASLPRILGDPRDSREVSPRDELEVNDYSSEKKEPNKAEKRISASQRNKPLFSITTYRSRVESDPYETKLTKADSFNLPTSASEKQLSSKTAAARTSSFQDFSSDQHNPSEVDDSVKSKMGYSTYPVQTKSSTLPTVQTRRPVGDNESSGQLNDRKSSSMVYLPNVSEPELQESVSEPSVDIQGEASTDDIITLQQEYLKLQKQLVHWQQQLLTNQTLLQKQRIIPDDMVHLTSEMFLLASGDANTERVASTDSSNGPKNNHVKPDDFVIEKKADRENLVRSNETKLVRNSIDPTTALQREPIETQKKSSVVVPVTSAADIKTNQGRSNSKTILFGEYRGMEISQVKEKEVIKLQKDDNSSQVSSVTQDIAMHNEKSRSRWDKRAASTPVVNSNEHRFGRQHTTRQPVTPMTADRDTSQEPQWTLPSVKARVSLFMGKTDTHNGSKTVTTVRPDAVPINKETFAVSKKLNVPEQTTKVPVGKVERTPSLTEDKNSQKPRQYSTTNYERPNWKPHGEIEEEPSNDESASVFRRQRVVPRVLNDSESEIFRPQNVHSNVRISNNSKSDRNDAAGRHSFLAKRGSATNVYEPSREPSRVNGGSSSTVKSPEEMPSTEPTVPKPQFGSNHVFKEQLVADKVASRSTGQGSNKGKELHSKKSTTSNSGLYTTIVQLRPSEPIPPPPMQKFQVPLKSVKTNPSRDVEERRRTSATSNRSNSSAMHQDPRGAMLDAIKNFGGRQKLRKVSKGDVQWRGEDGELP